MTYREICERLKQAGIETAEWDAACLLERYCGVPAATLPLSPEKDYRAPGLLFAVERREARYPLQYLLGEWSFFRQTYEVSPDCLIPRSDTEILVEEAIRRLPENAHFADLCTGSGCIAISVLAERKDTEAVALEKFPKTLALAVRNAQRNGVAGRMQPLLSDVLSPPSPTFPGAPFDAILSNPPYIRSSELSSLAPELSAEPPAALDGGTDGLLFYRAILQRYTKILKPGGFFLLEIGFDQAEKVAEIARREGLEKLRILQDLSGCDRVLFAEKSLAERNDRH